MTIDQMIATSASVGALLAAVATFLTVNEMSKQRSESYMPELVFSRMYLESGAVGVDPIDLATSWRVKGEQAATQLPINITNIGLGTAKNVRIDWSFPLEQLLPKLNSTASKLKIDLYMSLDNGILKMSKGASIWRNQQMETLDYVLPVSIVKQVDTVAVPSLYLVCVHSIALVCCGWRKGHRKFRPQRFNFPIERQTQIL
jgi:hypothetical protein